MDLYFTTFTAHSTALGSTTSLKRVAKEFVFALGHINLSHIPSPRSRSRSAQRSG